MPRSPQLSAFFDFDVIRMPIHQPKPAFRARRVEGLSSAFLSWPTSWLSTNRKGCPAATPPERASTNPPRPRVPLKIGDLRHWFSPRTPPNYTMPREALQTPALNPKIALASVALAASCLSGTAALDRGLIKQGSDAAATLTFLAACTLWLYARHTLKDLHLASLLPPILLGWWTLNLALCAACGGPDVYRTIFFAASSTATASLILFSLISAYLTRSTSTSPALTASRANS
jgi:hypothetical protein